jgi:3-deoxy-D-manno-octulosonic-acid transferase
LSVLLYNIFLFLYKTGLSLAALWNGKARKWVQGRKNSRQKLSDAFEKNTDPVIWVHCASLGEFEQGRPVIEGLKENYPGHKILLTFFSPSGYEVQQHYAKADWVFYMPLDGAAAARHFLETVRPVLVVFVKYEFWYYYLKKVKYRQIPLLLISALFRPEMSFFKWYASMQRKMLSRFDHLFVQNEVSRQLLAAIGIRENVSVAGDTRFDRVLTIADHFKDIPAMGTFAGQGKMLVAGSTWAEDLTVLAAVFPFLKEKGYRLVIAPHETDEATIIAVENYFSGTVRYSAFEQQPADVLIIDNIGMLSRLYYYASITYVGGAMTAAGVHNVLEAAVYGKPVLFGPFYKKYSEAVGLVQAGGAFSFTDANGLKECLQLLITDQEVCKKAGLAANAFVEGQRGSTEKILGYIQKNRLLTS